MFYFTRGERILIVILLALLVAGGGTLLYLKGKQAGAWQKPFFVESPLASDRKTPITAHVAGEVRKPGVVALPGGARVGDAIAKAGGLTERADPDGVNLAAEVLDGQKIEVPAKPAARTNPNPSSDRAQDPGRLKPGERISINRAGAEELERLPGIGPAYARRIVAYRRELKRTNGHGFTATEHLMNITGIGPRRYADIRDYVKL